jgi:hypothetical protein
MPDREKVIKAIETHISTDDSVGCDDCTYENDGWCMTRVMTDALALLKEQPEIIRCKDCKHRTKRVCNNLEFYECEHLRYQQTKCGVTDDWFCADGERRGSE